MSSAPITAFGQGLRRDRAALYVGVSATKFDDLVARGIMPKPRRIDGCVIWLRDSLDAALFALDDGTEAASPYDEVAA
jgi:predicted DNA-binding transcriptional regulator AlpA